MIDSDLAHYRVTGKLGEGGMGEVYRAQDTKLGREVAIKVLPEGLTADPERLTRFEREARVLASLNHPNIASIYSFETAVPGGDQAGETGSAISFLVMELAPGGTLADRIARGPIASGEALPIARQMAEALEAAHEKGIIHRDLKPANIKLDEDGNVKVLDFGLAKALDPMSISGTSGDPSNSPLSMSPTLTAQMTGANVLLGTAAYMSPEQAKGKAVDKRSDIWAFGVVVWEMLTGQRLFTGDSVTDILADVLRADIDVGQLPSSVPAPLVEVLRRCLERSPNRRLHDIADARLVIEDMQDGGWEAPALVEERASRGFPLGLAIGALAGLVVGALLVGGLFHRGTPETESRSWRFEIPIPDAGASKPAISPDGSQLAYTSEGQLWIRAFDRLEPRAVTGGEGASTPFWAPDGKSLGFSADGALWRLPVEGGTRALLANLSTGTSGGAVWLPGERVVFNTGNSGIFEVSALGGETRTIVEPGEGEVDFHHLETLPDGSGFLTVVHKLEDQAFDNVTLLKADERIELIQAPGDFIYYPTYSETGHILYVVQGGQGRSGLWAAPFSLESAAITGEPFLVSRGAQTPSVSGDTLVYTPGFQESVNEVVWVDRDGRVLESLGEPRKGMYPVAELSPTGDRTSLIVTDRQGGSLWVMDLGTGQTHRVAFEENSVLGLSAWDPVSGRIAYAATSGGDDLRLMIKSPDSSTQAEILTQGNMDLEFSHDGRFLIFVRPRPGFMNDLWWRNLEDGTEEVFVQTDTWDISPSFSPDDDLVAYRSNNEVYVTRFPQAEPRWQISEGGGASPEWSADGRHLYFFNGDEFFEVGIEAGASFRASTPVRLFKFKQAPGEEDFHRKFAVDGNGERFLMVRVSGIPPGIVVHQNWLQDLQRN